MTWSVALLLHTLDDLISVSHLWHLAMVWAGMRPAPVPAAICQCFEHHIVAHLLLISCQQLDRCSWSVHWAGMAKQMYQKLVSYIV